MLLAEAVGPNGHVTGIDVLPEFISYGTDLVNKSAFADMITLKQGDIKNLPFDNDSFDWVWSADCAGYPAEKNPPALLEELSRIVKPGGQVIILAYSSQMLLPGYSFLEARLNATCSSYIPIVDEKKPGTHFLRALGWFRDIGLEDVTAKTFVRDFHAPLSADIRAGVQSLIEMLWGEKQSEVSDADWAEFQRVCPPNSPDSILDRPDYYGFFTYSMFIGQKTS
jgi:demethylmenaquinone methyltransferase/2-methoxy-6-polyprenyl-1,4-benzoquinol methylase